ncbi:TlpA disulfide reductase family protein [Catalinimonas sp. 4WD22]|uniref:TlpA family protein disulfide reductase n=1 Tax=Catalinimonas locisalis TaxID=3133978 RepID=UPI0031013BF0
MTNKKYMLLTMVLLVLGSVTFAFILKDEEQDKQLQENKEVETSANYGLDFSLVDKDGQQINLKDYQGKTVVLNFWASWCPPCIAEMPTIQTFYDEINKDEVKLVLVALDRDFNKSINFMENKGFNMPYYRPASNLPSQFDIRGIPITYIINGNGEIVITHSGMADFSSTEFKESVEKVAS